MQITLAFAAALIVGTSAALPQGSSDSIRNDGQIGGTDTLTVSGIVLGIHDQNWNGKFTVSSSATGTSSSCGDAFTGDPRDSLGQLRPCDNPFFQYGFKTFATSYNFTLIVAHTVTAPQGTVGVYTINENFVNPNPNNAMSPAVNGQAVAAIYAPAPAGWVGEAAQFPS